jgi:hypothetical protein
VGYDNEAWQGLVRQSGCGWATPMRRPEQLAKMIATLSDDEIDKESLAAIRFATDHTFEIEFARRMEHLRSLAR